MKLQELLCITILGLVFLISGCSKEHGYTKCTVADGQYVSVPDQSTSEYTKVKYIGCIYTDINGPVFSKDGYIDAQGNMVQITQSSPLHKQEALLHSPEH